MLWTLLVLLGALFCTACGRATDPQQLGKQLAAKLSRLQSYQLTCTLENGGQTLVVTQWYSRPDSVRTDVSQPDEPLYRFFSGGGKYSLCHLPSGLIEELTLNPDHRLFLTPLLLFVGERSADADWVLDPANGCYQATFTWSEQLDALSAQIWVDEKALLPRELRLFDSDEQLAVLRINTIVLNPPLDASLFLARQN